MSEVSDSSILFDLEFRGVDDFLATVNHRGLEVPEDMADRIIRIIKEAYGFTLQVVSRSEEKKTGHFCLVPYDCHKVILKRKRVSSQDYNTFAGERKQDGLRVGQAFCNHFNITDGELFHEVDEAKAWNMIEKDYVEV